MPDFTTPLSKGLDARRRLFHTTAATLALLDFARPDRRGYDVLINVPDGWHLHTGKDLGEAMVLEIAETATVTREKLDKAVAFGIYIPGISDPMKAWVLDGDESRKAPTYANKRIWVFTIKPTGESVNT